MKWEDISMPWTFEKRCFFLFNFRRFYELIMVSLQCVKREFLKDKFIC